jgi:hypothetical protein
LKDKDCIFKPKINPVSAHIDRQNVQKVLQEHSFQNQSSQLSQALFGDDSAISKQTKISRVELLLKRKEEQEQRLKEM